MIFWNILEKTSWADPKWMLQNYIQSFYLNIERNISIMVLKNGLKNIFFDDYSGFQSKTTHPRHGGV